MSTSPEINFSPLNMGIDPASDIDFSACIESIMGITGEILHRSTTPLTMQQQEALERIRLNAERATTIRGRGWEVNVSNNPEQFSIVSKCSRCMGFVELPVNSAGLANQPKLCNACAMVVVNAVVADKSFDHVTPTIMVAFVNHMCMKVMLCVDCGGAFLTKGGTKCQKCHKEMIQMSLGDFLSAMRKLVGEVRDENAKRASASSDPLSIGRSVTL